MGKVHILFVDDEVNNLKVYEVAFHGRYYVHTASSGAKALEILAEYPIRLLITDQRMSEMTGTELIKEVSKFNPSLEIIILTAYSDLDVILDALNKYHVFQYLLKPIDVPQLRMVIDAALQKSRLEMENRELIASLEESQDALREANAKLEEKVAKRTQELEVKNKILLQISQEVNAKNEKITQSLNYSRKLQQAILLNHEQIKNVFPETFFLLWPKDIVSGDFFWYHSPQPGIEMLALADCTGHGIPGAFMTILGHICLEQVAEQMPKGYKNPASMLHRLDEMLQSILAGSGQGITSQDGMDIFLCAIDRHQHTITYSSAKGMAYLHRQQDMLALGGYRHSIGYRQKVSNKAFENAQVSYTPGDMLYLSSDGYQDQFGGESTTKFLRKNFSELLAALKSQPIEEQEKQLKKTFTNWKGDSSQTDDITVVGVRLT